MSSNGMFRINEYKDAIAEGIKSGNWSKLEIWFVNISAYIDDDNNHFPQSMFQEISRLLVERPFLEAEGSHAVLRLLEHDWYLLAQEQQQKLLSLFEKAFPKFCDYLSKFLIAEMLGEQNDEPSLQILKRLILACTDDKTDESEVLILAIYEIAQNAPSSKLKKDAKDLLVTLRNNNSIFIADSAKKLLRNLDKK